MDVSNYWFARLFQQPCELYMKGGGYFEKNTNFAFYVGKGTLFKGEAEVLFAGVL
jgi:hypothetical protein